MLECNKNFSHSSFVLLGFYIDATNERIVSTFTAIKALVMFDVVVYNQRFGNSNQNMCCIFVVL